MANKVVWVGIPVQVPAANDEIDVADYIKKFIDIGMNDLQESIDDEGIDNDDDDAIILQVVFGQPQVINQPMESKG